MNFLISDIHGDTLLDSTQPAMMMRDYLGLSQRQLTQQATREVFPRNVTPTIRPLTAAPPSTTGWIARAIARIM